jgi:beta-mannosidase
VKRGPEDEGSESHGRKGAKFTRRGFVKTVATGSLALAPASKAIAKQRFGSCSGAVHPDAEWGPINGKDLGRESAIQVACQRISLDGGWSLTKLPLSAEGMAGLNMFRATRSFGAAQVPGEVHFDLIRAGLMPDPNVKDNARTRCRWPEQFSWWYRTEFEATAEFADKLEVYLTFDGIDLAGEVFFNGHSVGKTANAFCRYRFDIKPLITAGKNEIIVRVTSGMETIPPRSDDPKRFGSADGVYFQRFWDPLRSLRKPDYSAYGHDWCDALPNIGIWRSVSIEGLGETWIADVRVDTRIDSDSVWLHGEINLHNAKLWEDVPARIVVNLDHPDGSAQHVARDVILTSGKTAAPLTLQVSAPRLWWPNNMGSQPLYRLSVALLVEGKVCDRLDRTIGLRTIEIVRNPLAQGSSFTFKVNGTRLFCRGGNWAPADLIPARVTREHYRSFVRQAKDANFNMLMVNGVSFCENDDFYDACDEAGILVWQQFAFSDGEYPDDDPAFIANVRSELESEIKRLRHHASLAAWCGNSECQMFYSQVHPENTEHRGPLGGLRIYNELMPEVCGKLDPARPFWPGTPYGGKDPNSDLTGDKHGPYGGLAFDDHSDPKVDVSGVQTLSAFRADNLANWDVRSDGMKARFVSEYGFIAPPHRATMEQYMGSPVVERDSLSWKIHLNMMENGTVNAAIQTKFGPPENLSLDAYVHYGQLAQADYLSATLESLRFRYYDSANPCDGGLIWSFNDCWGEVGWSVVDCYGRPKAAYFAMKRSAKNLKLLCRSRNDRLIVRLINDGSQRENVLIRAGWLKLDEKVLSLPTKAWVVQPGSSIDLENISRHPRNTAESREAIYVALMFNPQGRLLDYATWRELPERRLNLIKPQIHVRPTGSGKGLFVISDVYCRGVHFLSDLPPSDSHFDLFPGVPHYVELGGSSLDQRAAALMPFA